MDKDRMPWRTGMGSFSGMRGCIGSPGSL